MDEGPLRLLSFYDFRPSTRCFKSTVRTTNPIESTVVRTKLRRGQVLVFFDRRGA